MFTFAVLILISSVAIQADHFNGGTITWAPVNPNTNSSTVVITITQSYSWVLSAVSCAANVPISTSFYANSNANLVCVAGCTNQGNYNSSPINILTDCTWSSTSLDMMKSQRSRNVTLNVGAYFTVAYRDRAWRNLENTGAFFPDWSIASLIDVRRRPDGIINTPPVSSVASPQYVIVNRTTQLRIPVSDVNDRDDIRCRWSANPG